MDAIIARIVGAKSLEDIFGDNEILKNSVNLASILFNLKKIENGFNLFYLSKSSISAKIITAGLGLIGTPIPTPIDDIVGIALVIHGGFSLIIIVGKLLE